MATVQTEGLETDETRAYRTYYMYCPACRAIGPTRVQYRHALEDKVAHELPGGCPAKRKVADDNK